MIKTSWKSGLRRAWMQTVRDEIKKRDNYTCQECGKKRSLAKVSFDPKKHVRKIQVHHVNGIRWDNLRIAIDDLFFGNQITLCEKCHAKETKKNNK